MSVILLETRRVVYWLVLFMAANVGVKAAYAIAVLLLAAAMSPGAYADFGLLYALQGAMTTFAVMGLVETTAGRLKAYPAGDSRAHLFSNMSGLFLLTALASACVVAPIVWVMAIEKSLSLAAVLAVLLGAVVSFSVLQASFHRIEERNAVSLLSSIGVPGAALIGLMIGGLGLGRLDAMFGLGLAGAGAMVLFMGLTRKLHIGHPPSLLQAGRDAIVLLPFLAIGILGWLSGYGMSFVIDWRFDPHIVAAFTFLLTASSISQVIANSMNMVWAPRFYALVNDGQMRHADRLNRHFFSLLAGLLGVVGLVAVGLFPWIAEFAGGNIVFYGRFRLELALLLAGYVICIPYWQGQNYYHVSALGKELMHLALWSGGAGLVVWIGAMLVLGPVGCFVGFMLQMAIKSVSMWHYGRRHWPLNPPWLAVCLAALLPFAGLLLPGPLD